MTPDAKAFASALIHRGPHRDIPADQRLFEPFIGGWALDIRWFDEGGGLTRRERGEWRFAHILEGRGVQDVWLWPPVSERAARPGEGEYGTSVRFYDPDITAWRSIWAGPAQRLLRVFVARAHGQEIRLESTSGDGPALRWTFFDVAPQTFRWRNEIEEGGRWRVQQTFAAQRVSS